MVVAVGVDLVSVKRFKELYDRYGERLLEKVFPEGVDYCFKKRRGELHGCLAARFALKEALIKAFSQIGVELTFSKVKIIGGGREMRVEVEGAEGVELLFSISHEREYAVAVVNLIDKTGHNPV